MSDISERLGKFGPLSVSLVKDTSFDFYRFFYRRNNNDVVYSITLDNIVMRRLDLDKMIFRNYETLSNYLNNISDNVSNISNANIAELKTNIITNFLRNAEYGALEVILPVKDENKYSQMDVDNIYNAIFNALNQSSN